MRLGVSKRRYVSVKLPVAAAHRLRRRMERDRQRLTARAETTATIEAARRGENLIHVGHHANLLAVLNGD